MSRYRSRVPMRGGLFSGIGKFVKKAVNVVGRIPVVGTVAKVAVSQIPVVGAAITAVNAFKAATTPVTTTGLAAASTALLPASIPGPAPAPAPMKARRSAPKKRKARRKAGPARKRRAKGVSSKQRAARARFARAAKKGRIRKGQRL